jgi:hypothetical protein
MNKNLLKFRIRKWKYFLVRNNIFYIEDIASESSVICITESHLDNNVSNSDMVPGLIIRSD